MFRDRKVDMKISEVYKREPIRDPNWKFPFGKHKDVAIREVLACDYQYVMWLMNTSDFDVHCDLLDSVEENYQTGMRELFGSES